MKLIKPYTEIRTPINGEEILKAIELAARTCYKSKDKIEYEKVNILTKDKFGIPEQVIIKQAKSARILIPKLISLGHEAMLEFGGMINVLFVCDIGVSHELVSHELVRHRPVSFAQESTRYCNYGKDEHITFIIPIWLQDQIHEGIITNHPDYPDFYNDDTKEFYAPAYTDVREATVHNGALAWLNMMSITEEHYNSLIHEEKWQPQQARSVLPNSLKTEINVAANIREWRHIFKQRTAKAAHPQMRELMCPLLDEFKSKIPILFDDINY